MVLQVTRPDGSSYPLVIGLPGDREVDLRRLEAVLLARRAAPRSTRRPSPGTPPWSRATSGPGALGEESASGIRFLTDPRVADGTRWITGANEHGRHVFDLVAGRDFTSDGLIDVAEVREGDPCPDCVAAGRAGTLTQARGIEIGHIFQLGRKYAEALDLTVLDELGKQVVVTMGSYGIGVSRAVAAVAEQHHDDKGLVWPREVSPFDVHVVATGKDATVLTTALELAADLEANGLRVLVDDRKGVSPGVKFNDSELIGVPLVVVVGKKLADGQIEVKDRASGVRRDVELNEAVAAIVTQVADLP